MEISFFHLSKIGGPINEWVHASGKKNPPHKFYVRQVLWKCQSYRYNGCRVPSYLMGGRKITLFQILGIDDKTDHNVVVGQSHYTTVL